MGKLTFILPNLVTFSGKTDSGNEIFLSSFDFIIYFVRYEDRRKFCAKVIVHFLI